MFLFLVVFLWLIFVTPVVNNLHFISLAATLCKKAKSSFSVDLCIFIYKRLLMIFNVIFISRVLCLCLFPLLFCILYSFFFNVDKIKKCQESSLKIVMHYRNIKYNYCCPISFSVTDLMFTQDCIFPGV